MLFRSNKRLLIGVSSPVGYFYGYDREKVYGKPTPILESPLSYCLLYDEIWFLTRKICPPNMEKLDFVHFVDEDLMLHGLPKDFFYNTVQHSFGEFPWKDWKEIIVNTIGGERWSYDNHSRGTKFGELLLTPTPFNYNNLLVDRYVATQYKMDLVENTANAIWSKEISQSQLKLSVSEKLLTSQVSSFQTIDGPWHDSINDLRNDDLLKQYRKRIQETSIDNLTDIDHRVNELSNEFEKITLQIVRKNFETTSLKKSAAMFVLGLIPAAGTLIGGGDVLNDINDKMQEIQENGWVGFLGTAKVTLK